MEQKLLLCLHSKIKLLKQIKYQKGYCKKTGYLEKDNISYDIDAHLPHNLLKLISAVTQLDAIKSKKKKT